MSKATLNTEANRLRRQIAEVEAQLDDLRARLAKIVAELDGQPKPETGLDMLWKIAVATARNRSSKQKCRVAWNMIPKAERPTIEVLLAALTAWNKSPDWKKDNNSYVPGLDKWIKARQWENLPEVATADPLSRYRATPKPRTETTPEDIASPADIAALFAKPKRVKS